MDLKISSVTFVYTFILFQQFESKIQNVKITFKKEKQIAFEHHKDFDFTHPYKFIKINNNKETLSRTKRTSTLVKNKDPDTPLDSLEIIHPVIRPEYGMLFEHQGYFYARTTQTKLVCSYQATKSLDPDYMIQI